MRTKFLFIFSFLVSFSGISQISGYVYSMGEKQPVPYVNITVDGEKVGFTSSKNGAFEIPTSLEEDTLIFSSIGYKMLRKFGRQVGDTVWMEIEFELLSEVVVTATEPRFFEPYPVKKNKRVIRYLSNSIPWRLANYYPYSGINDSLPNISSLNILTNSPIKNAVYKVSIVKADKNGTPTNQPLISSVLVHVKKRKRLTTVDLAQNLDVPKNGFFVIVETLHIKENEYIFTYYDENDKKVSKTYYAPEFIGVEKDGDCCDTWNFTRGKWYSRNKFPNPNRYSNRLAISVIYSN